MTRLSRSLRFGTLLLLLLALSAPSAAASAAASPDPIPMLNAVDTALNAHDAPAVMALLADDSTVQDDRAPQTAEQIRGWLDQLIAEDVHVDLVGQPQVESAPLALGGTRVSWRADLALDRFRRLGLPSVKATVGAVVVQGHIVSLWLRPDPDWPAYAQAAVQSETRAWPT